VTKHDVPKPASQAPPTLLLPVLVALLVVSSSSPVLMRKSSNGAAFSSPYTQSKDLVWRGVVHLKQRRHSKHLGFGWMLLISRKFAKFTPCSPRSIAISSDTQPRVSTHARLDLIYMNKQDYYQGFGSTPTPSLGHPCFCRKVFRKAFISLSLRACAMSAERTCKERQ
jgi:hypothetical protein